MEPFAQKLIDWRKAKRWTAAAAVEWLSGQTGIEISLRTYQGWEAGKVPLGIARSVIEKAIEN